MKQNGGGGGGGGGRQAGSKKRKGAVNRAEKNGSAEWNDSGWERERGRGTKVGVGPAADRREIPKGRGRGGCWAETERQTELS